ncbi:MAG: cold shock domain-containing protein, partial [Pirellulaceae bacterium]|nr:cold shock domain-containing protein [Pirellulaceae bacterium]
MADSKGPPANKPSPEDDEPRNAKRFPIQRKHLGMIKFLRESDDYGFIESENFREDVFFHFT